MNAFLIMYKLLNVEANRDNYHEREISMPALSCYSLISIPRRYLDIHGNWICNTTVTLSQAIERTCYRYHAYDGLVELEKGAYQIDCQTLSLFNEIAYRIVSDRTDRAIFTSQYSGFINCIIMWREITFNIHCKSWELEACETLACAKHFSVLTYFDR